LLAGAGATVTVTIGGTTIVGGWAQTPFDGIGMYHGNVSMNGLTGAVTITLSRGGATITGTPITTACTNNIQNWNAWVGYAYGETITATPTLQIGGQVCIAGTGANNFQGLCEFTCHLGYCPVGACVCTEMGAQIPLPTSHNVVSVFTTHTSFELIAEPKTMHSQLLELCYIFISSANLFDRMATQRQA
jgi:hypothetical protein